MAEADNPLRAVLITGCSSGIGLCLAHGLRARGWRVFATARKPADVTMLVTEGFESLPLDVDSSDSIAVAVDEVLQRTGGRLDALINNAGFGLPGAIEDLSRASLRVQFETSAQCPRRMLFRQWAQVAAMSNVTLGAMPPSPKELRHGIRRLRPRRPGTHSPPDAGVPRPGQRPDRADELNAGVCRARLPRRLLREQIRD
ncbi:MAG: SDR family NAD(P)-dependent oxidoreductase [Pseudomonadota bacterium]